MKLLAIDIGSSSIKAAVLTRRASTARVVRVGYPTKYDGARAEVDARAIEGALHEALHKLGKSVRNVDLIAPTVMAPSWVAMDKRGHAITPVVTHQDRRAIAQARRIESEVGEAEHLRLAGVRPFPGGISSTTCRWFLENEKSLMRRADLIGHLSTWLIRQFCDGRVVDPSNAGFMGVYETLTLRGWSDTLIDATGIPRKLLPEVREANAIAGTVTKSAARRFGLTEGTPMLTGCMDGSGAMLATGGDVGQLLNVSGSTDVLALLVDRPRPHKQLLTRPLGVGRRWLAVGTIAAAGSAIEWVRQQLYADVSRTAFSKVMTRALQSETDIVFDPSLAGSRTEIEERAGSITGLRLGTTREEILAALCAALATQSGERLALLRKQYRRIDSQIVVSGGVDAALARVLRRDWASHGRWHFRTIENATVEGLWRLAEMARE